MGSHATQRGRLIGQTGAAAFYAPPLDNRAADVSPAHSYHRLPDRLSGALFDLPVDAEQVADPLYRAWQLHLPAVARRILDGGATVGDLRVVGGVLQSADRPHHRPSHQ